MVAPDLCESTLTTCRIKKRFNSCDLRSRIYEAGLASNYLVPTQTWVHTIGFLLGICPQHVQAAGCCRQNP